jgi:hypothetical protein
MVNIKPEWLTRIILGQNISGENERAVREFCKQRKPELIAVKSRYDPLDQSMKIRP